MSERPTRPLGEVRAEATQGEWVIVGDLAFNNSPTLEIRNRNGPAGSGHVIVWFDEPTIRDEDRANLSLIVHDHNHLAAIVEAGEAYGNMPIGSTSEDSLAAFRRVFAAIEAASRVDWPSEKEEK